jgi:hypothetical protein
MFLRRFLFLLFACCALGPPLFAQVITGTITSNQCVQIAANGQATVYIHVGPTTWSGTLQPSIGVGGQTADNTTVVPTGSTASSAQSTITANGGYSTSVAAGSAFQVCGNTVASGTATVTLQVSDKVNSLLFGGGSGGGTNNPGGSAGQIQCNGGSVFCAFTASGDASINTTTGAVTVTKTNGTAFGSLATLPLGTAAQFPVVNSGATASAYVSLSGDCTMTAVGAITCTKSSGSAFGTAAFANYTSATAFPFQSLTTTGSGAATLSGGVLNIPVASGGLSGMTATQIPVAASASTVTSSIATSNPTYFPFQSLTTTGSGAASLSGGVLNIPIVTGTFPGSNQGNDVAVGSSTGISIPATFHSASFSSIASANSAGTALTPTSYELIGDPSSTAWTVSSTLTIGTAATQGGTFQNNGVPIDCTGTSGDCLDLGTWGKYLGVTQGASPNGSRIYQSSGSTLYGIVGNSVITGAQSNFALSGIQATSDGHATNAVTCVLCITAVEGRSYIRDSSFGANVGQIGMNFQDAASGSGDNNNIFVEDVESFCSNLIHCLPLNVWGPTGTGTGVGLNYTFLADSFVDVGSSNPNSLTASALCQDGHDCTVNLDGTSGGVSSANYIGGAAFYTPYFESAAGMDSGGSFLEANNLSGLAIISGVFNGGPDIQNCVLNSESSTGKTGFIFVLGTVLNAKCADAINNTVTGYTMTTSGLTDIAYLYPGDKPGGGGFVVDGNQVINGTLNIGTANAGLVALVGAATNPTLPANAAGFLGPSSASFTKYFLQLPSTAPSGTQYLGCGTPSSNVSTCAWGSGGGGPGTGTQYTHPYWSSTSALGSVAPTTGYDGVPQQETNSTTSGVFTAAPVSAPQGVPVDIESGATFTVALTDRSKVLNTTNTSTSTAVTVPAPSTTGFGLNFVFAHLNSGSVVATDTPTTATVNGNSAMKLVGAVSGHNPEAAFWWEDSSTSCSSGPCYWGAEILPTDANGRLGAEGFGALTGDVTNTAGSYATTVGKVNGGAVPASASVLATNSSSQPIAATAAGIGTVLNLAQYDIIYSGGTSAAPLGAAINGIQEDSTSAAPSAATAHQIQIPSQCADTSGSGTAQSCTTSPTFTPAAPDCVTYTTATTNSGTGLTTNINSLGAKSIAIAGSSGWTTTLTASIVPANKPQLLCYDGTNWDDMQTGTAASGSGGITFPQTVSGTTTANTIPYLSNATTLTGNEPLKTDSNSAIYQSTYTGNATSGSVTINPSNGPFQTITLTGNVTSISFTQPTLGSTIVRLKFTQAASGGPYTITWTAGAPKWPGGIAPVMSSSASAVDWYSCLLDGTNTWCTAGQNFQ